MYATAHLVIPLNIHIKKEVSLPHPVFMDPLSLVSTTEELLERKSSSSGLEIQEYASRDSSRRPHGTLYPQPWH
jgi:hypothetical protein